MSIKATFNSGSTTTTTKTLYQWDYGQKLEIESADLPSLVEVHFACSGMKEAVVVPCSVDNGVAMVSIPNQCLEQTSPITAWVYEYGAETDAETGETVKTSGATTKTITIPVTARARPNRSEDIPQTILDKYAELIAEVNEAIGLLHNGDVVAAKAVNAETAAFATAAGNANYASSAGSAGSAVTAASATTFQRSPGYSNIYTRGSYEVGSFAGGIILFEIKTYEGDFTEIGVANVVMNVQGECYSPLMSLQMETDSGFGETAFRLHFTEARDANGSAVGNKYHIDFQVLVDPSTMTFRSENEDPPLMYRTISYSYLSTEYPVG